VVPVDGHQQTRSLRNGEPINDPPRPCDDRLGQREHVVLDNFSADADDTVQTEAFLGPVSVEGNGFGLKALLTYPDDCIRIV
jgi:hypothetical protein